MCTSDTQCCQVTTARGLCYCLSKLFASCQVLGSLLLIFSNFLPRGRKIVILLFLFTIHHAFFEHNFFTNIRSCLQSWTKPILFVVTFSFSRKETIFDHCLFDFCPPKHRVSFEQDLFFCFLFLVTQRVTSSSTIPSKDSSHQNSMSICPPSLPTPSFPLPHRVSSRRESTSSPCIADPSLTIITDHG